MTTHITLEELAVKLIPRVRLPWLAGRIYSYYADGGPKCTVSHVWMDLNYEGDGDPRNVINAFKAAGQTDEVNAAFVGFLFLVNKMRKFKTPETDCIHLIEHPTKPGLWFSDTGRYSGTPTSGVRYDERLRRLRGYVQVTDKVMVLDRDSLSEQDSAYLLDEKNKDCWFTSAEMASSLPDVAEVILR